MATPHDFSFDPTYGYDQEALGQVPAPPGPVDFASFWQGLYAQAAVVAPRAVRSAVAQGSLGADVEVFEVEFTSRGGRRIGGWLTLPRAPLAGGVVVGHGYGGREGPDLALPLGNVAAIFPCARGLGPLSRYPDIPDHASAHVLHQIDSRDTYVHGGCAADLVWCAASALIELVPEAAGRLDYIGGSFGGGIGALALPWDARFRRAYLSVPSFGNHPLRLTLPCTGSGEAVRIFARDHPDVINVLRYFDAATAARHLRVPTLVAAARFDPAVPPPGQFAVYNGLPGPKELFVLETGHFANPNADEESRRLHERLERFFAS